MKYFRYEMTIEDGEYWFEILTKDVETAKTMKTYCDWMCGQKLKEDENERSKENS